MSSTRAYEFIDHTFDVVVVGAGVPVYVLPRAPSKRA